MFVLTETPHALQNKTKWKRPIRSSAVWTETLMKHTTLSSKTFTSVVGDDQFISSDQHNLMHLISVMKWKTVRSLTMLKLQKPIKSSSDAMTAMMRVPLLTAGAEKNAWTTLLNDAETSPMSVTACLVDTLRHHKRRTAPRG